MTYYQLKKEHVLDQARKYREEHRDEINRKQRERYATNAAYRKRQREYLKEYYARYCKKKGRPEGLPKTYSQIGAETTMNRS